MRLVQALVDGLLGGAPYALFGLAFSITWASMRLINFAFPQVAAATALVLYTMASVVPPVIAFLVALVAGTATGLLMHYVSIWPTRRRSHIISLMASLAAGLLLQGVLEILAGPEQRPLPPGIMPEGYWTFGTLAVRKASLLVLTGTVILFVLTILLLRNRKIGVSFRAAAWAPQDAEAYGVNVRQVQLCGAVIAAFLAALAGVSIAGVHGAVNPFLGFEDALKGTVAMLLGGGVSVVGTLLGGMVFGISESVGRMIVEGGGKELLTYVLLFAVLLIRPKGLIKGKT